MRIFIIVQLDFEFCTLSDLGQQFEAKLSMLSVILSSLGHEVDRLFIHADMAKACAEDRKMALNLMGDMLLHMASADKVFLAHRCANDNMPVWWPPMRDLLHVYNIKVHESLDTLLGYKD